jgi:quercetin dioxygenase-like cupin family protein
MTPTPSKDVFGFALRTGLLFQFPHAGNCLVRCYGVTPNFRLTLEHGYSHYGFVLDGQATLMSTGRWRGLYAGDCFSIKGTGAVFSNGNVFVVSQEAQSALPTVCGPLEPTGRFPYEQGVTTTLIVPPVKAGDPCLNHIHFAPNTPQVMHTHDSLRIGVTYRGQGELVADNGSVVQMTSGKVFVIKPHALHAMRTLGHELDVVSFHPDSASGFTDENNPMRTGTKK